MSIFLFCYSFFELPANIKKKMKIYFINIMYTFSSFPYMLAEPQADTGQVYILLCIQFMHVCCANIELISSVSLRIIHVRGYTISLSETCLIVGGCVYVGKLAYLFPTPIIIMLLVMIIINQLAALVGLCYSIMNYCRFSRNEDCWTPYVFHLVRITEKQ